MMQALPITPHFTRNPEVRPGKTPCKVTTGYDMVKGCDYHVIADLIRNPEVKGWADNKTNQPPYPSPLMGED